MAELYHGVDIVERTEITREGRVQKVYRVSAFTKSDVRFTIDVKEADFTKEKVDKILAKEAGKIEAIKAL
ncbi:unnamed protein product [marine sediment metagenome]|uniref:Uncharacterized protein n=1 Tax=marine sediment metagenome TaxID=412755 RepID=X1MIR6_9ZZZZ